MVSWTSITLENRDTEVIEDTELCHAEHIV